MRKAQIRIQEMAFILLAFVLLFMLAFLFFGRWQAVRLAELRRELAVEAARSLLQRIASLPELRCPEIEILGIDKTKLDFFEGKRETFRQLFTGVETVEVIQVRPREEWLLYEKTAGVRGNITRVTFVPLCERMAVGYSCSAGTLKVTV